MESVVIASVKYEVLVSFILGNICTIRLFKGRRLVRDWESAGGKHIWDAPFRYAKGIV